MAQKLCCMIPSRARCARSCFFQTIAFFQSLRIQSLRYSFWRCCSSPMVSILLAPAFETRTAFDICTHSFVAIWLCWHACWISEGSFQPGISRTAFKLNSIRLETCCRFAAFVFRLLCSSTGPSVAFEDLQSYAQHIVRGSRLPLYSRKRLGPEP